MSLARAGRELAKRVIFWQSAVGLVVALFFLLIWEESSALNAAFTAILGWLVCVIPNVLFSFFAFRFAGASKNRLVVKSFAQGSKLKLFSAIFLFTVAYQWEALIPLVLLVSYAVVLLSQWPIIMFIHKRTNK